MKNLVTIGRKTDVLLKFRLTVYFLAFAHLAIMSIRLLGKDFDQYEDATVQVYAKLKWKLITTWSNLLSFAYIPVCFYCDWCELKGSEMEHIRILNKIRDFAFTNLILPSTAFADILFWKLWHDDKALVSPPAMEGVIQLWEHHSMHTVPLVFVIFDLIFVRRQRPKSMVPGVTAMLCFISLYMIVCVDCFLKEEYLYPVFRLFSVNKLLVLAVYAYTSFFFYHTVQWQVVDFIHSQRAVKTKNVS